MQVQDDPGRGTDLDLRHYLRIIGRRKWIILAFALVLGLASMGYALTKADQFRASAQLLLLAPTGVSAEAQGFSDEPDRAIANEVQIFGSEAMQRAVTQELGEGFPGVSATAQGDNDIVVLTSESPDPERAKEAVNAYAAAYERLRRQRTVAALRRELDAELANVDVKQAQMDETLAPLTEIDARINALPLGPERDALLAQRTLIEENLTVIRENIQSELGVLQNRIADLRRAMMQPSGGVDVLNPATTPSEPFFPQPKKDLFVGIFVGLILGLTAAFVWEQLDDAVRGRADADRATGGLPVVGLVPRVTAWRNAAETRLVTRDEPRSSAAEAYRSLVTSLEFLATDQPSRVILFTSPGASEGKSTTVANVGLAFTEAGHRTVVVDADLRRPRLQQFFDVADSVGLSTVLTGKIDIATAVQAVDGDHPVDLVPAGPIAPNPAELLRSDATETALTKLRDAYDVVLVDCPPVLPVADALVLSRHADIAILVASADGTSRRKLSRSVEALQQVDAPLRGLVLNGVGASEGYEYGYYGDDEATSPEKQKRRGGRRSRRLARS